MTKQHSIYDRLIYHLKNRRKSMFSLGYLTASQDIKRTREKILPFMKKRIEESKGKKLSSMDHSLVEMSKGYIAFNSDIKK